MQYQSTRDKNLKASSAQAILNGLAPDGGLYTMPSFDEVKFDYTTVLNMDTMSMSTKILSKLLPDFSEAEMAKLVHDGYTGKFETDHLTPTVPVARISSSSFSAGRRALLRMWRSQCCRA